MNNKKTEKSSSKTDAMRRQREEQAEKDKEARRIADMLKRANTPPAPIKPKKK